MKPLDFPLLADENISPEVVAALVARGGDARTVIGEGLGGHTDTEVLRHAHLTGRVVLTHDTDFGTLAIAAGEPYTGIIFLRPGHIETGFVLGIVSALETTAIDVVPPFIVVAERRADAVRVRVRQGHE